MPNNASVSSYFDHAQDQQEKINTQEIKKETFKKEELILNESLSPCNINLVLFINKIINISTCI